jgi:hypothetical protein
MQISSSFPVDLIEIGGMTLPSDIHERTDSNVRFGVFRAVNIQVEGFWVVVPCSVVVGYQCFRGPCCLHLQDEVFQFIFGLRKNL